MKNIVEMKNISGKIFQYSVELVISGHSMYDQTAIMDKSERLLSPWTKSMSDNCLSFTYRQRNGALKVVLLYEDDTYDVVMTLVGDHLFTWRNRSIDIDGDPVMYRIAFDLIGGVYGNDLDIKAIKLLTSPCVSDRSVNCSFDDTAACGYDAQFIGSHVYWIIVTGLVLQDHITEFANISNDGI